MCATAPCTVATVKTTSRGQRASRAYSVAAASASARPDATRAQQVEIRRLKEVFGAVELTCLLARKECCGLVEASRLHQDMSSAAPKGRDVGMLLNHVRHHVRDLGRTSLVPANVVQLGAVERQRIRLTGVGGALQHLRRFLVRQLCVP